MAEAIAHPGDRAVQLVAGDLGALGVAGAACLFEIGEALSSEIQIAEEIGVQVMLGCGARLHHHCAPPV